MAALAKLLLFNYDVALLYRGLSYNTWKNHETTFMAALLKWDLDKSWRVPPHEERDNIYESSFSMDRFVQWLTYMDAQIILLSFQPLID